MPDKDGIHTQPGGVARIMPTEPSSPLLATFASLFERLSPEDLKAINIVQLQYAKDVSTRAAGAYQQIIDILNA